MLSSHFWITVALTLAVALASPRPQSSMGGGAPVTVSTPPPPPPTTTVTAATTRAAANTTTAATTRAASTTAAGTTTPATTIAIIPWAYCCPSLTLFCSTPVVATPTVYVQYPVIFPYFQSFGWWCCG